AEMASFFHAFQSLTHLAPIELLTHGAQLGQRYSPVHLQKIPARAYVDAMNARRFVKNKRNRNRLRGLCEHADLRDGSARANRPERTWQRGGATHLDHQVHAISSGLVERPAIPIRIITIV